MLFSSYAFILAFLPVVLAVAAVAQRYGTRVLFTWLVLASLFFYGWWNPRYLPLILFSLAANYMLGRLLSKYSGQAASGGRVLLAAGISLNLLLLGYFKYANFFADTLGSLTGLSIGMVQVVLPIGISFFTFQQIAWLVDVRRGKASEHNFLHYALFVTFFPQLIAGPIVHHEDVLPQFMRKAGRLVTLRNLAIGVSVFSLGLVKKTLFADNLALVADPVFHAAEQGQNLHFFLAWKGAFAYTLQLYFDFSGYSDMAIGLGRIFGIRLPVNFNSPYKATGIIDFWRRWNMTLSRFLRDYLYIPLGGNRLGKLRTLYNVMVTMLLGGLWHGAGWSFVLWGGVHGVLIVFNRLWRLLWGDPVNRWWSVGASRALTFLTLVLTWVIFRAETLGGAATVFRGMINLPAALESRLGVLAVWLGAVGFRFEGPFIQIADLMSIVYWLAWMAALWLLPNTQEWMRVAGIETVDHSRSSRERGFLPAWAMRTPSAILLGIVFSIGFLGLSRVSEFIYFQF